MPLLTATASTLDPGPALIADFERDFALFRQQGGEAEAERVRLIRALAELMQRGRLPHDPTAADQVMATLFAHPLRERCRETFPDLLPRALSLVRKACALPYPEELRVSPWWAAKQRHFMGFCSRLTSPVDLVAFAQCTWLSGSDRRLFDRTRPIHRVILEQLRQLEQAFALCPPLTLPLEDSPYSMQASLVPIHGKNYSNSFLNMLGYALGSVTTIQPRRPVRRVLELGSGYGNLARVVKLLAPDATITLIDLPESLLLCQVYLTLNFPEARITFLDHPDDYARDEARTADFVLIPAQLARAVEGNAFDLTINTGSLQEMPARTVAYFMDLIRQRTDSAYFYSFNYFINARSLLREWSEADQKEESANICPLMDDRWEPLRFHLNPGHLTVDCQGRNWLELLARKLPRPAGAPPRTGGVHGTANPREKGPGVAAPGVEGPGVEDPGMEGPGVEDPGVEDPGVENAPAQEQARQAALHLVREADTFPVFSDPWLERLWRSVWLRPTNDALDRLLGGIELFTLGWSRPNHMFSGRFGSPADETADLATRQRFFEAIEEVRFYRGLLADLEKEPATKSGGESAGHNHLPEPQEYPPPPAPCSNPSDDRSSDYHDGPPHDHESHVFFLTSHGYAADHWFSWVIKALNAHPELLVLLGNEGSRPKYFAERSRKERPDLVRYARFLADVGRTYGGVGDGYSYRAHQMAPLQKAFGERIRFLNLLRHPYCWLRFYVDWRAGNMRMAEGENGPLEHEWRITAHDRFAALGLAPYQKEEVAIWSAYQGMTILDRMVSDATLPPGINQPLEALVRDPERWVRLVSYLTHGRVRYSRELLDRVYAWVWTPFRGEAKKRVVAEEEFALWPEWKRTAFAKLVGKPARDFFTAMGYRL
ncbi:MAG: putative sugar O-methyltransferase [Magnetococcales bacterium]|nr:putative sugar O-methyltransferase [Magnetococcales bacterium]